MHYKLLSNDYNALCFRDGTQLSQTFCMHVFADGCFSVSYNIKLFDLFLPS